MGLKFKIFEDRVCVYPPVLEIIAKYVKLAGYPQEDITLIAYNYYRNYKGLADEYPDQFTDDLDKYFDSLRDVIMDDVSATGPLYDMDDEIYNYDTQIEDISSSLKDEQKDKTYLPIMVTILVAILTVLVIIFLGFYGMTLMLGGNN